MKKRGISWDWGVQKHPLWRGLECSDKTELRTNYYIVVAAATNDRAVRQTKRRVEYRFGMDSSANNASCAIEGFNVAEKHDASLTQSIREYEYRNPN